VALSYIGVGSVAVPPPNAHALIELAAAVRDWRLLEEAVDAKIGE
jgi:hypothetical protein